MNGFLDHLGEAGARSADIGSVLDSIAEGFNCAVGNAGEHAGLPAEVRDDLEEFKNINPGLSDRTASEPARAITEPAAYPDPSEFFSNIDPGISPAMARLPELLNDPAFPLDKMLGEAVKKLEENGRIFDGMFNPASVLPPGDETPLEENTESIRDITERATGLNPESTIPQNEVNLLQAKMRQVNQMHSALREVLTNLNTVRQMTARKLGG